MIFYFSFFMRHFEKLKPLLHIDPIMQCAFTYVCPLKDRSHLICHLSPYLCIGIMIKRLREKEWSYWVCSVFNIILFTHIISTAMNILQSTDLVLQHIQDITLALKSPVHISTFRCVYKICCVYLYHICTLTALYICWKQQFIFCMLC